MKASEKKMILLLVIIVVIIIGGLTLLTKRREENPVKNLVENQVENEKEETNEEFVEILEDGTKLNKSEKLHETKRIEGLEIKDIQVTENENVTLILGTITNTSDSKQGGYIISLKIIDKEGKEIETLEPYIPELEAGESTQLNTNATKDFANAYDFIITKK